MIQSVLGLLTLTAIAWLFTENRRAVSYKGVIAGLAVQLALGLTLIRFPGAQIALLGLNRIVEALQKATLAGTSFVFGYVGGAPAPFAVEHPGAGFSLAFQALPLLLVISALSALLFYLGILPRIVRAFAFALGKTLGIGGPLGVVVSSNAFLGMLESPLLIRPYISNLTRSELFVMMTCGMAMIAGTVMIVYAGFLHGTVPNPIGQLLTASLISAPASITVGRLMVPETQESIAGGMILQGRYHGVMDAISKGTVDGLQLVLAIASMLIVLIALVALLNGALGFLPDFAGQPITLQRLLGSVMSPVAWLMGIPWNEAGTAGGLLGTKVVLNEFIAYLDFVKLPQAALSPRSKLIVTYALCSFANFGSLGMMIGGLGTLAPARRAEIVSLGLRSVLSGTIVSCMTGATAGILAA